ncbi:Fur family transcriptional regulator, ferric uptake regulator [Mucilaginibacter mallensis]|uniref:Fur family transcriptional regulator, ferric uptake regulator n=1 Tax=Mucilaginibacter mallensis TaxID=652787 RepID=A0A1H1TL52_MUCMA|nr:transcriptional repressor [Mucilaginibacter mallensis]SDS60938.1 Fur family transcriptional regulator, ferric uptake regulator [Mucilaginibacter mallensis]
MPQVQNDNRFEHLLDHHHLKKTGPRLRVLSMMSSKNTATSQPDLENLMHDVDRVTLYRILNVFEEKGIIHKVFDLNGTANYAICHSNCEEHNHQDEHLHFNCTVCNNVYCLNDLNLPSINLPAGFKAENFTLYASGLCPKCSKKENKK